MSEINIDSFYDQAVEVIKKTRRASLTWLQRRLDIGYQETARLIELLEERGVIGAANANGPREILI